MFTQSPVSNSQRTYNKIFKQMKEVVATWNLTEMHQYVMCKNDDYKCNFVGFNAILDKFINHTTQDKNFPNGRREFEAVDRPERIKKGLDLVVILCKHPRSNYKTMKAIQSFLKLYMDLIREYDQQNSEHYREKLLKSFRQGLLNIEKRAKRKKRLKRHPIT
jgi:hypothetical protein